MLEVYDKNLKRIAFLQNAYNIKRTSVLDGIGSLSFKLPKDDPKVKFCEYMNFVKYVVKVNGENKRTDYYRIAEKPSDVDDGKPTIDFYCEHGIITLIDKLLFGSYTIGGLGYYTAQALRWILDKQDPVFWQLGDCDFARQFQYNWSQENLLTALFSIPNRFSEDYIFEYNMETFPWTVSLKRFDVDAPPKYFIRKRLNQLHVKKAGDAKQLATRIYPLGYGEGVNQLTIRDVNGGVPYLQAPKHITDKYGIIERPFIDRRFTNAENLKARAQVLLDGYSQPYEEYELSVSDLFTSTSLVDPLPRAGDIVSIPSSDIKTFITAVTTTLDNPGEVTLSIANRPRDIASSISNLADRQRIEQIYSQGATNIFSYTFRDNADENNPLKESFLIPQEAVKINSVMLKFELRNFRAYEKGASAGAAQSSTSSAGGGQSSTSSDGGAQSSTSSAGGGQQSSTNAGGLTVTTTTSGGGGVTSSDAKVLDAQSIYDAGPGGPGHANHNHGILAGTWLQIAGTNGGAVQWTPSGGHTHSAHAHNVMLENHSHSVTIDSHAHSFSVSPHSHSFSIGSHSHNFSILDHTHTFEVREHTHELIYGIFEAGRADSVVLRVDGALVPIGPDVREIDIAPYLSTDGGGKILRGAYHDIELLPNKLTGILGSITVQLFIQSQGGGDY